LQVRFLGSRLQRVAAVVLVTAITLLLIGAVILTTTPLGCAPARSLKIKLPSARCQTVASLQSPSPFIPGQKGGPSSSNPFPEPVSSNPNPEPATYYPNPAPYSTAPYPDASSGGFPYFGPASGPNGQPPAYPMACTLPIFAGGPGSGGFILFPSGQFQPDPRSAVAVPSPSPGTASPPPQQGPAYQGFFGLSYDRAYSRWLPVPYRWVSPDGKRYAYSGASGGIYVQNISTNTEVELGEGSNWNLLDVGATGVYAVKGQTGGLWLLPYAGGVTTITTSGYWQAVWGTAAYGTITSSVPNGVRNNLLRLDLPSATTTDYFSPPQGSATVVAFSPNGNPVIYVYGPNGLQIWTGLGSGIGEIADFQYSNFYPNGPPIVDSHGIWLAGNNGAALRVEGQGWYWMSGIGGQLAGGCA
jgi:hypothetical protein